MTDTTSSADAQVEAVRKGYAFTGAALELGALLADGQPLPDVQVRVPLEMLNRHGLVAGATGTGKTKTLQLMAEQLSAQGVPVFLADIKGDLSGVSQPGQPERQADRAHAEHRPGVAGDRLPRRVPGAGGPRQRGACPRHRDELRAGAAGQGARSQRDAVVEPAARLPLRRQG